jgi:excisionase family DNA binding protein
MEKETVRTVDRLITTREFADMANLHLNTVRDWCKSGRLKAVQPFPRAGWRIPESEFARLFGEVSHGKPE